MKRRPRKKNYLTRFASKIEVTAGCWNWLGATKFGYGAYRFYDKMVSAHRLSYQIHRGIIPEGLHLDHLCRNRSCVNPWHLEAVTRKENNRRAGPYRRGVSIGTKKTHCIHGHEYTPENTKIKKESRGDGTYLYTRECWTCHYAGKRRARERKRVDRYISARF